MNHFAHLSVKECRDELQRIYREVQKAVDEDRRGGLTAQQPGAVMDFLEEWNSEYWQKQHLPVSMELIAKHFAEKEDNSIRFQCPHRATTEDSPRYLLLMSGFSIEQLVLSIVFHNRCADEHNSPLAGIVPFISKDAWNEVEPGIYQGLSFALRADHADAVGALLEEPVEVKPGDPAEVFKKILEWSRANPTAAIALDVTGGQKPMDTGGTYAAMYLGASAYYLDFDRYDNRHRRPYPDTLKYVQLALPSAVFSHDARKAVVELFRTRRFRAAYDRVRELQAEMKAGEVQEYFEDEKDDFNKAVGVLKVCNAWMTGDYCHESMAGDRLHSTLCAIKPSEPKSVLNSLLKDFGESNAERRLDLLFYSEDEYWRLRTMLYLGSETRDDRTCASIDEASELIREVVVGTCALTEFALDAVFHLPTADVKIDRCDGVRLEFGNSPPADEKITQETELLDQHGNAFRNVTRECHLPVHRFPPASTSQKIKLVQRGEGTFRVFLPAKNILKALREAGSDLKTSFHDALNGLSEVGPNDKRFEFDLTVSTRRLLEIDPEVWSESWGDFGNARKPWMSNRNAIAHMRATATKEQLNVARNAIEMYLPRFLGMLKILSQECPTLPITDDAAWQAGQELIAVPRGPWHEPDKGEAQLRRWLRLPLS